MTPPSTGGARCSAWVLGILVAILVPMSAAQGQGREEVTSLNFEGNDIFSDKELAAAVDTRQTSCRSVVLAPFCWGGAGFALDPAFFAPRSLARDMARLAVFYYRQGYREVTVDTLVTRPDSGRIEVTFRLDEGRPVVVDSLTVVGVDDLEEELLEDLPLRSGDPLNLTALSATRDTLINRLRNNGFAYADVLQNYYISSASPYQASVEYDIDTGPASRFGAMLIIGNEKISDAVVRRMLPFQEGTPYSHELVVAGQRNLYSLEIFRHASITELIGVVPDTLVPLEIRVNEGDVHRIRGGGGWSTAECFAVEGRWISRNFLDGARRLQLRLRLDNIGAEGLNDSICPQAGSGPYGELNWQVSADFTQPWVFSPRNSLAVGVYTERRSLPDIFVREGVGVNLAFIRAVSRVSSVATTYRPQLSTVDAAGVIWCANYLVCTREEIDILQQPNWLSPLGLNLTRDTRNNVLNPVTGSRLHVDYEYADDWTGSDFGYQRIIGEISFHRRVSGWVAGARVRAGYVEPQPFQDLEGAEGSEGITHPQKRFYAGGANSVRGYAQNQLGPKSLTTDVQNLVGPSGQDESGAFLPAACAPEQVVDLTCDASPLSDNRFVVRPTGGQALLEGSVEARFPLFGPRAEGAAYVDFGQVFSETQQFGIEYLEFTPGVGVRYLTPIGPIRIDVAYRFTGGENLDVLTEQIRPFDPAMDSEGSKLIGDNGQPIDWVRTDELAPLLPQVLYNDSQGLSLGRFQLHLSIGQAF